MRYNTKQHPYYCGIDLHARTMYLCIVDRDGKTLFHENMAVNAEFLQRTVEPFLPHIAVECIFDRPGIPSRAVKLPRLGPHRSRAICLGSTTRCMLTKIMLHATLVRFRFIR